MTHDRLYYFLPYWDDKPCMHVRSVWPDLRRRMYNSNVIARIADRLEEGLSEVHGLSEQEDQSAERRLRAVLDDLNCACARYVSLVRQTSAQPGTGKTKLDRERARLCEREIVRSERKERRTDSYSCSFRTESHSLLCVATYRSRWAPWPETSRH